MASKTGPTRYWLTSRSMTEPFESVNRNRWPERGTTCLIRTRDMGTSLVQDKGGMGLSVWPAWASFQSAGESCVPPVLIQTFLIGLSGGGDSRSHHPVLRPPLQKGED